MKPYYIEGIGCISILLLGWETKKDIEKMQISILVAAICAAAGVIWNTMVGEKELLWFIWGIIPGLFLLVIGKITKEAVGYGDGMVLSVCGILWGLRLTVGILFTALLLAGIFSLSLIVLKKVGKKECIPFMPFLMAAYLVYGICTSWV